MDFTVEAEMKIKKKWKEMQLLRPCLRTEKKLWNEKVTEILIVTAVLRTVPQRLNKKAGRARNQTMFQDYPNNSIIMIAN